LKLLASVLSSLAVAAAALLPAAGTAQSFPSRPVRVIMPYPVGGGVDNVMRIMSEKLAKLWGQPVIIENKPGGNGWIGIEAARRARPDGYTLLMVDAALFCLQPHLFKQLPFDPFRDFEAVAPVYSTHFIVVTGAESKWNSVADLISAAKEKPGQVTYGSSGVGSLYHLGGSTIETAAGVRMTHVPYKDTMQIFTDIAGGGLDWSLSTFSTAAALQQAGKVKFLAIAAPKRDPSHPDVPTIGESGGPPDIELRTWVGLFAPAGTPRKEVERLSADVARVMADPEVIARLSSVGMTAWSAPAAELKKALDDDFKAFGAIAKKTRIELK
jgi:tripartite-type tricarboxylate transporter receptor subunit TctC